MDAMQQVVSLLEQTLDLNGRAASFTADTQLLGALPELNSMAVLALITGLEERLGIMVDDDEIDGRVFATVGSLTDFVRSKLAP